METDRNPQDKRTAMPKVQEYRDYMKATKKILTAILYAIIMGIIFITVGFVVVDQQTEAICNFCENKTGTQQSGDLLIDCDGTNKCCPFIQNLSIYSQCLT
jgi:hypothetical protein